MDPLETLVELFKKFPGIGPRQARRFVFYLLRKDNAYLSDFASSVKELKKHIGVCNGCFRFFTKQNSTLLCPICADTSRDERTLMVVADDVDIDAIEKSNAYRGRYFVLGGLLSVLEKAEDGRLRTKELRARIEKKPRIEEIILALDASPEGDYTLSEIRKELVNILAQRNTSITHLGRGLSTGTELEYSDPDTIQYALKSRLKNI